MKGTAYRRPFKSITGQKTVRHVLFQVCVTQNLCVLKLLTGAHLAHESREVRKADVQNPVRLQCKIRIDQEFGRALQEIVFSTSYWEKQN